MDQPRPLPSTYPSPRPPLNDQLLRLREPLTEVAGNSQFHALTQPGFYQDEKGHQPRMDMQCSITLPSNHPRQTLSNTLENRRQILRRRRQQRYTENPVFHSHQYQNYRNRQNREGNSDEAKWPAVLEDAFLDGIILYSLRIIMN
jgi:transcriptional enhancer factor